MPTQRRDAQRALAREDNCDRPPKGGMKRGKEMGLFGTSNPSTPRFTEPLDPQWARSPKGGSFRLLTVEPDDYDLSRASGVYVVWHGGVRPRWVFVGRTDDLASAINDAANNDEIAQYDINGRVFVTWAFVKREFQDGVVAFLIDRLKPLVDNPSAKLKVQKVPVITP